MIYAHSLGHAARLSPDRAALWSGDRWLTFTELDQRVAGIAGALSRHGFGPGDRLAVLMPNGADYLQLIYACTQLGVIVVPLNVRLSVVEIDRILADASPHGLIRHSSLPLPTVPLAWQRVLDQEPLGLGHDGSRSAPINDPDAVLALIYTSGTTGHPKGVVVTHANLLAQFPELGKYDLASLDEIAYGGSPMAPELIRRIREVLPGVRLVQGYGLSETGFLTALRDDEHVGQRLTSCGRPAAGIEVRV